jgi:uncharacterized protein (DUF2164 family)
MARKRTSAGRGRLAPERRAALVQAIVAYSAAEFDEPLSAFRAEGVLDLVLDAAGAALYNQGVRDALAGLQPKLLDLEAELSEPETDG